MNLYEALDAVYDAFSVQLRPKQIVHEPYELQAGEVKQLLSWPLRELSPGLMRSYLFDALYTVGTWEDFRYFLPRLLEVFIFDESGALNWEGLRDIADRLDYARENSLPLTSEQAGTLYAFSMICWRLFLWTGPRAHPADVVLDLRILQAFGPTTAELVQLWRKHPQGAWHLAHTMEFNGTLPPEWHPADAMAWLEAEFLADPDGDAARTIVNTLLYLQN